MAVGLVVLGDVYCDWASHDEGLGAIRHLALFGYI